MKVVHTVHTVQGIYCTLLLSQFCIVTIVTIILNFFS